jgi:hypothetical protein
VIKFTHVLYRLSLDRGPTFHRHRADMPSSRAQGDDSAEMAYKASIVAQSSAIQEPDSRPIVAQKVRKHVASDVEPFDLSHGHADVYQ